ncbi:MAG: DEAD/DEAH box helicase [Oscillospiraceae bacterium]|jgi:ATP-dependent RNA helicase DeaD|nr:DEAD/DEAH box helicase [Oscillospiraceae bacterium]
MQFKEMNLIPEILRAIEEVGYTEATDIQSGAIPVLLSGKDLIGRSNTGTGKTAAFGIPAVQMAAQGNHGRGQILILSPTRELAMQTGAEVRKFSKYLQSVKVAVICGGESMPPQIRQLRTAQIIVGTPGRIMDHMRRKTLSLKNLKTVVLDEADEMLNMGFVEDIQTILRQAPENRQTVLFSATLPAAILKITKEFQTDPQMVAVDKGQKTVDNIAQFYCYVPRNEKTNALALLLEYHRPKQALIFCNTKKMVNELCEKLGENGFQAAGLHGDLKQNQRNLVMSDFKHGRTRLLVATDVAARGIDVENVDSVFNYDIPDDDEYYIHRIGRTGRAGKTGTSYTLVTGRAQLKRIHCLEKFMGLKLQEASLPNTDDVKERHLKKFRGSIKQFLDEQGGSDWVEFVDGLEQSGYDSKKVAAALCQMLYNKNKSLKTLKNVSKVEQSHVEPKKKRFSIDMGASSRINADFIVGTIVETTGLPISAIGKIDIEKEHSTFEIASEYAGSVLEKMNGCRMKQRVVHISEIKGKKSKFSKDKGKPHSYGSKRHSSGKKRYYSGPAHHGHGNKK